MWSHQFKSRFFFLLLWLKVPYVSSGPLPLNSGPLDTRQDSHSRQQCWYPKSFDVTLPGAVSCWEATEPPHPAKARQGPSTVSHWDQSPKASWLMDRTHWAWSLAGIHLPDDNNFLQQSEWAFRAAKCKGNMLWIPHLKRKIATHSKRSQEHAEQLPSARVLQWGSRTDSWCNFVIFPFNK